MLNLKNTLDGYLKNVEVIGNTIQDTNDLANIRSVGDKVEGQELYKIDIVSCGKNMFNGRILRKEINTTYSYDGTDLTLYRNSGNTQGRVWFNKLPIGTYTLSFQIKSYPPTSNLKFRMCKNLGEIGGVIRDFYLPQSPKSNKITFTLEDDMYISVETDYSGANIVISNIQLEEGNVATEYEPYQEQKLEILSPVQLEKVGDVADRIIEKNGVWGVEKNIKTYIFNGTENIKFWNGTIDQPNTCAFFCEQIFEDAYIDHLKINSISNIFTSYINATELNHVDKEGFSANSTVYFRCLKSNGSTVDEFKKYIKNLYIKYQTTNPTFIPLPHDQQIKLRTFAGQTNIAFLTEIPGQIKAQVPKSLGATVNTHTEQIADLHNSLDRVKKLEETTVSTVETESNFTTVNETSNGYFEDVKLEGKTLVNICPVSSIEFNKTVESKYIFVEQVIPQAKRNTVYTICVNVTANQSTNSTTLFTFINNTSEGATGNMKINGTGYFVSTLKTLDIEFSKGVKFRFASSNNGNVGLYKCENLIILEGDHTNNPPSYFEGLMSVGQDVEEVNVESGNSDETQSNKKPLLYYNPTTETWEKPILREWDTIEKHSDGKYYYHKRSKEVVLNGSEEWSGYDIQSHINTFGAKLPFKDVENVIGANCMVDTIPKQPSAQVSVLDEEGLYLRGDSKLCYIKVLRSKLSTQDIAGFKAWLKSNPTTVVYQLEQEEVYECTNIDLMTYSGETNYIINSGAISPKSLLKVHNNISNVVKILQEKVSLLENTFIAGLKSVLSGDMYSLATILYPEDFEQNDNTEQDIMVIPE